MNAMNILLATSTSTDSGSSVWILILECLAFVGILYLVMVRPQQKKKKKEDQMREGVQVGDDITTIGGIVGRVVGIKEDAGLIIIETGTDRAKIKIKKWAVGSVDTIHEE